MKVLFVHGMGRTPISGWPMLHRLRQAGMETATFGYSTTVENFAAIRDRLVARIAKVAAQGEYFMVGHSLGGVLLRAALLSLPKEVERPRHIFLLGSPIQPARLAGRLQRNLLYRAITGDSGQLLASMERMAAIGPIDVPITLIAGVGGPAKGLGYFGAEPNDGIVSLSEVSAPWLAGPVQVPVIHTLLPASGRVADIIIDRMT